MPRPGRPREFELGAVLDAAMAVFRRKGFAGASIRALCANTGLSRASLYNCFGDKRGLFLAVLEHYMATEAARLTDPLEDDRASGAAAIGRYLDGLVAFVCGDRARPGCLLTNTVVREVNPAARPARMLERHFARREDQLAAAVARGRADGSIHPSLDPVPTARFLVVFAEGLAVLGATGLRGEAVLSDAVAAVLDWLDRGAGPAGPADPPGLAPGAEFNHEGSVFARDTIRP